MHLQAFPFDQQTLRFVCRSEDQSKEELVFVISPGNDSWLPCLTASTALSALTGLSGLPGLTSLPGYSLPALAVLWLCMAGPCLLWLCLAWFDCIDCKLPSVKHAPPALLSGETASDSVWRLGTARIQRVPCLLESQADCSDNLCHGVHFEEWDLLKARSKVQLHLYEYGDSDNS